MKYLLTIVCDKSFEKEMTFAFTANSLTNLIAQANGQTDEIHNGGYDFEIYRNGYWMWFHIRVMHNQDFECMNEFELIDRLYHTVFTIERYTDWEEDNVEYSHLNDIAVFYYDYTEKSIMGKLNVTNYTDCTNNNEKCIKDAQSILDMAQNGGTYYKSRSVFKFSSEVKISNICKIKSAVDNNGKLINIRCTRGFTPMEIKIFE